jgi:hypothetical protein
VSAVVLGQIAQRWGAGQNDLDTFVAALDSDRIRLVARLKVGGYEGHQTGAKLLVGGRRKKKGEVIINTTADLIALCFAFNPSF